MMMDQCPGAANLRTPTLDIKNCPKCGAEVELFSTDKKASCGQCGFTLYTEIGSCIQWCQYAKKCLGEELFEKLKEIRQK